MRHFVCRSDANLADGVQYTGILVLQPFKNDNRGKCLRACSAFALWIPLIS
jgi:hypothetical protein